MNKEKYKYILMPVVALIWGIVIFMYFFYEPKLPTLKSGSPLPPISLTAETTILDTFSLYLNYQDPFLKKAGAKPRIRKQNINSNISSPAGRGRKKTKEEDASVQKWPQISFLGVVKKSGDTNSMGLLKINGNMYTVNAGNVYEGVKVLQVNEGGMQLEFNQESKWIGLSN